MTVTFAVFIPAPLVAVSVNVVVAVTLTDTLPFVTGRVVPRPLSMLSSDAAVTSQERVTVPPVAGRVGSLARKELIVGATAAGPQPTATTAAASDRVATLTGVTCRVSPRRRGGVHLGPLRPGVKSGAFERCPPLGPVPMMATACLHRALGTGGRSPPRAYSSPPGSPWVPLARASRRAWRRAESSFSRPSALGR